MNKTILVCGHYVGKEKFGGERSLINVLEGLAFNKYDIVTLLPSFDNKSYLNEVLKYSRIAYALPYQQWNIHRPTNNEVILEVSNIISKESIDILYANTIVLHEPIIAARKLKIPVVIHVRELFNCDPFLCEEIGLDSEEIMSSLINKSDAFIVNSVATMSLFAGLKNVHLVNNCVSEPIIIDDEFSQKYKLRVGMISSNNYKKGVVDFIKIAEMAFKENLPIEFINVGPMHNIKNQLDIEGIEINSLPPNLKFLGYIDQIQNAFSKFDILLSLSYFGESFGRSVAEAFAYRKPVIAYNFGALNEIVTDGISGFLVPHKSINSVLDKLIFFLKNPDLINKFGLAGSSTIRTRYSQQNLNNQIGAALKEIADSITKCNTV